LTQKSIIINPKHIRNPYLTLQEKYRDKRKLKKLIQRWAIAGKITLTIVIAMLGWWLMNRPTQTAGAIETQHTPIKLEKMEHIALIPEEVKKNEPKEKTIAKQAKNPTSQKVRVVQLQVQSIASEYGWGTGEQWEALSWIMQKESGFNPVAQNPKSTAFGLFQHLDMTRKNYNCPKTSDITTQVHCGVKYIKARYGDPIKTKMFWEKNRWY
jgi:hypothetical protein